MQGGEALSSWWLQKVWRQGWDLPALTKYLLQAWALGLAVWAPAVMLTDPILGSPDTWLELRVGQWIWTHSTVPTSDPFSVVGASRGWIAYSWFFQLSLFQLYQWFGLNGVLIGRVLSGMAVALSLYRLVMKRTSLFPWGAVLWGLALLSLKPLLFERAWLWTMAFFCLTLDFTSDVVERDSRRAFWLLPLIFVVWANVHIQFVYGLMVVGLAAGAAALRAVVTRVPSANSMARRLALLFALCGLATLINPYGHGIYSPLLSYTRHDFVFDAIKGFSSPAFREAHDWVRLGLLVACVAVVARTPRLWTWELGLALPALYVSFSFRRDSWMLAVLSAYWLAKADPRWAAMPARQARAWLGLLALIAGLVVSAWSNGALSEGAKIGAQYPEGAAAFVEKRGYGGALFNDFSSGGYLIWRLPHLKVSIDVRTDLHGDDRIARSHHVWSGLPGWDSDPDLNRADLIIAPKHWALTSLLKYHPRFELVFSDSVASVFVKRNSRR